MSAFPKIDTNNNKIIILIFFYFFVSRGKKKIIRCRVTRNNTNFLALCFCSRMIRIYFLSSSTLAQDHNILYLMKTLILFGFFGCIAFCLFVLLLLLPLLVFFFLYPSSTPSYLLFLLSLFLPLLNLVSSFYFFVSYSYPFFFFFLYFFIFFAPSFSSFPHLFFF